MEIYETRDSDAVTTAARIWSTATAKRDEVDATDDTYDEALPLIQKVIDSSDRSYLLVLSEDEEMLVFAALQPVGADGGELAELRYLGVAPGHWGAGWARRLLVALPDSLREHGFTEVELWVYADNIRAIFVYEAMGWQSTRDTRQHQVTGRTEQRYRLKLS